MEAKKVNIYNANGPLDDNQKVFDAYNEFVLSSDRQVFFKLLTRFQLFEQIKHLHGDIVEVGVFKGAGMLSFLKMCDMHSHHDGRKVIGFDYFDLDFVQDLNEYDKEKMLSVFTRCQATKEDISMESIQTKIEKAGFKHKDFELVKGDVSKTSRDFLAQRPGFRISLLYLDVDLEKPTYETLVNLWERVVQNGIVVFDEYGYHAWSEANAVDRFVAEHHLKLIRTNVGAPTAYIIKK